jgi:hypothetical protein
MLVYSSLFKVNLSTFNTNFRQHVQIVVNSSNLIYTLETIFSLLFVRSMILVWGPELFWMCWCVLLILEATSCIFNQTRFFVSSVRFRLQCIWYWENIGSAITIPSNWRKMHWEQMSIRQTQTEKSALSDGKTNV